MLFQFIKRLCKIFDNNVSFSYNETVKSIRIHYQVKNITIIYHIPIETFTILDNIKNNEEYLSIYVNNIQKRLQKDYSTYMERGTL